MELAEIDLLNRDVFTGGVPHDWFAYLREHAPIHHHDEPDGPGFWVITTHEDVTALNRDWATASSDQARGGVVVIEELDEAGKERAEQFGGAGNLMLTMDPPDHTRYRKLVNRGFTPRVIRSLEEHMRAQSVVIIERVLDQGGRCDFVVEVAAELPLEAIAEFLGRAPRRSAQALRLVESHDRERGPRVRGLRRERHAGAGRDVHVRPGARERPPPESPRRHRQYVDPQRGRR